MVDLHPKPLKLHSDSHAGIRVCGLGFRRAERDHCALLSGGQDGRNCHIIEDCLEMLLHYKYLTWTQAAFESHTDL